MMMAGRPGGPMGRPGSQMQVGRSKDTKATLKRMTRRFGPESKLLVAALLLGVFSVAFTVIGPKILGDAINVIFSGIVGSTPQVKALYKACSGSQQCVVHYLSQHGKSNLGSMLGSIKITPGNGIDFSQLGHLALLAIFVYLVGSFFSWGQSYIMAGVAQRTVARMRTDVEEKLGRLPLRYFDTHAHGDMLSRVTNDIDNISTVIQQGMSQLLTSILTIIGVLIMMFWISPLLAVVSLVTVPLAIWGAALIAKRSQVQFTAQWKQTGYLNGHVEAMHTGHVLVQVFGASKSSMEKFNGLNDKTYQASFKAQFLSGIIQPMMQFFSNVNYVLIAVFGGYRVATGALSFGSVVAFTQYARQFTQPMTQVASQMNMLQSGLASAERVFEMLDADEEERLLQTGELPEPVRGHVDLKDVEFSYTSERKLIEGFNLEVPQGRTVAIVGPTGAGKTTIVNLLMRFYEVDSGMIAIDEVPYSDLSRDTVRRAYGMVLQDTWLFSGTVRENIGYGLEGATDLQIEQAATAALADHFIRTLPLGYETELDGESASISAGQKQLLTIARAFLANPEILILDEATSSVDSRTEVLIQAAMAKLRTGRTSFVIAHRLSTIRNADIILVMESGTIVESGSHEDLMESKGAYFRLYNSQFTEAVN